MSLGIASSYPSTFWQMGCSGNGWWTSVCGRAGVQHAEAYATGTFHANEWVGAGGCLGPHTDWLPILVVVLFSAAWVCE
jgi:hypothetical protein